MIRTAPTRMTAALKEILAEKPCWLMSAPVMGVPANPAKPTTKIDCPMYVPIYVMLATAGAIDARHGKSAYLGWMVCGVRNRGHHQSDDDAARCTKKDC